MRTLMDCFVPWQAAIVAVSLTAVGVGRADSPPARDDLAILRAQGDAAVNAGHLPEALAAWRAAWDRRPDDRAIACNIGRAELRLGNNTEAATWLTRCVRLAPKPSTPAEIERNKQNALELVTARLRVSELGITTEPGARVVVDDKPVGVSPVTIFVTPGDHRVEVHNRTRAASSTVHTEAGKEYPVTLKLPPSTALPPPPADSAGVLVRAPAVAAAPLPPPAFQSWPLGVGGVLAGSTLLLGVLFTVSANESSANANEFGKSILADGKSCGGRWVDSHPDCPAFVELDQLRANSTNAAIASFVVSGVIHAAMIGYVVYETQKITIAPTVGGFVGKYQW